MKAKKIPEILEKIFDNINTWLAFAEAKNAANIALIIAAVAAILSWGKNGTVIKIMLIAFIISGVISLISFIPKMGTIYAHIEKFSRRDKINLLFYRDIYQYSGEEYLKLVYSHYSEKESKDIDAYELHLAQEIVYNSMIATMKYNMFKISILIDIFAFVLLIVFLLM